MVSRKYFRYTFKLNWTFYKWYDCRAWCTWKISRNMYLYLLIVAHYYTNCSNKSSKTVYLELHLLATEHSHSSITTPNSSCHQPAETGQSYPAQRGIGPLPCRLLISVTSFMTLWHVKNKKITKKELSISSPMLATNQRFVFLESSGQVSGF